MSIRNLTTEEVNALFPIRNFSDQSKQQLQETVQTQEIDANSILFSSGSADDQQYYLLEGKVRLTMGSKERVIEGGQMEARFPIDNNTPHQATAVAIESVTILSVKRADLDDLMNEVTPGNNGSIDILEESEESLLYNQLYFEVTQEMQADKLELPSIPETAIKVRTAVSDPNATSSKIAQITQQDPTITAQLIKAANSPLFRGRERVEALPNAITRLGLKAIANLITSFTSFTSFTIRMVFTAKTKDVKDLISTLWLIAVTYLEYALLWQKSLKVLMLTKPC